MEFQDTFHSTEIGGFRLVVTFTHIVALCLGEASKFRLTVETQATRQKVNTYNEYLALSDNCVTNYD